jgi:hypothetical protein
MYGLAYFTSTLMFQLGCSAQSMKSPADVTCGARGVDIAAARGITNEWTMNQIIQLLGAPVRDVGSGLIVNEWTCSDGTMIRASGAGDYGRNVSAVSFSK